MARHRLVTTSHWVTASCDESCNDEFHLPRRTTCVCTTSWIVWRYCWGIWCDFKLVFVFLLQFEPHSAATCSLRCAPVEWASSAIIWGTLKRWSFFKCFPNDQIWWPPSGRLRVFGWSAIDQTGISWSESTNIRVTWNFACICRLEERPKCKSQLPDCQFLPTHSVGPYSTSHSETT